MYPVSLHSCSKKFQCSCDVSATYEPPWKYNIYFVFSFTIFGVNTKTSLPINCFELIVHSCDMASGCFDLISTIR